MIFVSIFGALSWHKTNLWRNFVSLGHSLAYGGLSALRKRFGMHVLWNETWHVTVIPRNMLLAHLVLMTTDPCCCVATAISKNVFVRLILVSHVLEGSLVIKGHWRGLVGSVWDRGLRGIEEVHDLPIDVTGSHAKLVNLGGDMPGIAWHILLVEAHFAVAWTQ